MQYKISYCCTSHIGNVRSVNQDNFICNGHYMEVIDTDTTFPLCGTSSVGKTPLFGVFDGMGGEEYGEVAAHIAAREAAALSFKQDSLEELSDYCYTVNDKICTFVAKNNLSSMGTTAAMLAFGKKQITLCNIGDTRIFRFSKGILKQISKDHIAVGVFGRKPPLSQNLGIPTSELVIDPYLAQGSYRDGDMYLICSDGLTDMVKEEEITSILTYSRDDADATDQLLNAALKGGGRDNITIILCRIECNRMLKKRSSKKKRGMI